MSTDRPRDDPVLARGPIGSDWTLAAYYVGVIAFALVAFIVVGRFTKRWTGSAKVEAMRERAQRDIVEPSSTATAKSKEFARVLVGLKDPVSTQDGRYELQPESTAAAKAGLGGCLIVFGSIFIMPIFFVLFGSDEGIGAVLFTIPFLLAGLAVASFGVYQILSIYNPKPVITLDMPHVPLGETVSLEWRIDGAASRLQNLVLKLEGVESATYTRGTDTVTDTNTFYEITIAETNDPNAMAWGSTSFFVPSNSMPSFAANNNKIVWKLSISGDVPKWPDMRDEFVLMVNPASRQGK